MAGVMGFERPEYECRKKRTHARMEAGKFDSRRFGLERQREMIAGHIKGDPGMQRAGG